MAFYCNSTDQSNEDEIFYSDSEDESDLEDFINDNPLLSSIGKHRIVDITPDTSRTIGVQTCSSSNYAVLSEIIKDLSVDLSSSHDEISYLISLKQELQSQIGFLHRHISPPPSLNRMTLHSCQDFNFSTSPAASSSFSPAVSSTGSPAVSSTGSPAVSSTGSPAVSSMGSQAVSSSGSPAMRSNTSPSSDGQILLAALGTRTETTTQGSPFVKNFYEIDNPVGPPADWSPIAAKTIGETDPQEKTTQRWLSMGSHVEPPASAVSSTSAVFNFTSMLLSMLSEYME